MGQVPARSIRSAIVPEMREGCSAQIVRYKPSLHDMLKWHDVHLKENSLGRGKGIIDDEVKIRGSSDGSERVIDDCEWKIWLLDSLRSAASSVFVAFFLHVWAAFASAGEALQPPDLCS